MHPGDHSSIHIVPFPAGSIFCRYGIQSAAKQKKSNLNAHTGRERQQKNRFSHPKQPKNLARSQEKKQCTTRCKLLNTYKNIQQNPTFRTVFFLGGVVPRETKSLWVWQASISPPWPVLKYHQPRTPALEGPENLDHCACTSHPSAASLNNSRR